MYVSLPGRGTAGFGLVRMVLQSTQTIFNLYLECFKSFTSYLHFLLIKQITKQLHEITSFWSDCFNFIWIQRLPCILPKCAVQTACEKGPLDRPKQYFTLQNVRDKQESQLYILLQHILVPHISRKLQTRSNRICFTGNDK